MRKIPGFICDIDGTVALHTVEERAHYDYSLVKYDRPNLTVINAVRDLSSLQQPVFVSGRADENNGQVRQDTIDWLQKHVGLCDGHNLFMRPEFMPDGTYAQVGNKKIRDFRHDDIVKEEIYWEQIYQDWDIRFAIDDRPRVLRMWQALGITTFAVGTPWIEF